MTMTGNEIPSSIRRACNSSPSISGIRMSRRMHPAGRSDAPLRNAAGDSYEITRNPTASSRRSSERRTPASSSRTWITRSLDILGLIGAQGETKGGATSRIGHGADFSTMSFNNRTGDREAQSHALAFGGYERLEQMGGHIIGQAHAGIDDTDFDAVRIDQCRHYR